MKRDDKGQKEEEAKRRRLRERELGDLRQVLSSVEGRRFVWRLLSHCRVFSSIWKPSAEIHHLAGKQDVGHFVMAETVEADQSGFLKMMNEAKEYDRV